MIRQLGAVPEPVEVTYNNPKVAISNQQYAATVATWDAAHGITSQGYSDACEIPLARRPEKSGTSSMT